LADQAMRRGVIGAGEDDVAVAMELRSLPLDQFPRRGREAKQRGPFELIKQLQRRALGRAVNASAGRLHDPAEQVAIAVVHVAEGAPRESVALDVMNAALLHLSFVLRRVGPTRGDEEAVVLSALAIGALDFGVVERRVDDGRPQIIEYDPAGHAT